MTLLRPDTACRESRPCYAIVQTGRWYFQNQAAVDHLAQRAPWFTVRRGGHVAVRVYRLLPGDPPFPPGEGEDPLAQRSTPWPIVR